MAVAFITRPASAIEVERLRLLFSTFRDGSGQTQYGAGTLPGWRDFERAFAAGLGGRAPENKGVFDVFVPSTERANIDYGFSLKSKELSRATAIGDLATTGRVYMELSNSPAKLWAAVSRAGATEADFNAGRNAEIIGEALLEAVRSWHHEAAADHLRVTERQLDVDHSVFLTISYSRERLGHRDYQMHSFGLDFPTGIQWRYRSGRSLRGDDPAYPGECLFDWYPFSGGQLKYYPRASAARYASVAFRLEQPAPLSLLAKAARAWPDKWTDDGSRYGFTRDGVVRELELLREIAPDYDVRSAIGDAITKIKKS